MLKIERENDEEADVIGFYIIFDSSEEDVRAPLLQIGGREGEH